MNYKLVVIVFFKVLDIGPLSVVNYDNSLTNFQAHDSPLADYTCLYEQSIFI